MTKCARNVLKSLDRMKRRKTTVKKELTFPLEKGAQIVREHNADEKNDIEL